MWDRLSSRSSGPQETRFDGSDPPEGRQETRPTDFFNRLPQVHRNLQPVVHAFRRFGRGRAAIVYKDDDTFELIDLLLVASLEVFDGKDE